MGETLMFYFKAYGKYIKWNYYKYIICQHMLWILFKSKINIQSKLTYLN